MIIELPKKIQMPYISIADGYLIIDQLMRFEDLMYELTYALKKKQCVYCGKRLKRNNKTIDHRYPRDSGGVSITNNLFPCCVDCNIAKSNLTHKQFLEYRELMPKRQKAFYKEAKKQKQRSFAKIGYVLPKKWVEFMNINDVVYQKANFDLHGKNYYRILEFYNTYHNLPRPIIVDMENKLLDGYNILMFAREFNIQHIPVIKLENVVVIKYPRTGEN